MTPFEIEAIDGDERDANEIAAFRRRLGEPAADPRERANVPAGVIGAVLALWVFGLPVARAFGYAVLLLPSLLVLLWLAWRLVGFVRRPSRAKKSRYRLAFEADRFEVRWNGGGATYPLADVSRFEAGTRIVVVHHDGRREEVKPVMPTRVENEALVARLNEGLAGVAARGVGYRVVTEEPASEDGVEANDGARWRA